MQESDLPPYAKLVDVTCASIFRRHDVTGPMCHAGSLMNDKGAGEADVAAWRADFAAIAPGGFVGVDIFDGLNVDVVADLCDRDFEAKHPALVGRFGVVFASALLEHVKNPFDAARSLSAMVAPGGHLYYQGPWVWGYHAYPDDYWRISHSGLDVLFPELEWRERWWGGTSNELGIALAGPQYERKAFRFDTVANCGQLIADRALPYMRVGAIGRKPA